MPPKCALTFKCALRRLRPACDAAPALTIQKPRRDAGATRNAETWAQVARARFTGNMVVSEMEWRNPWPNRASRSKFRSRVSQCAARQAGFERDRQPGAREANHAGARRKHQALRNAVRPHPRNPGTEPCSQRGLRAVGQSAPGYTRFARKSQHLNSGRKSRQAGAIPPELPTRTGG